MKNKFTLRRILAIVGIALLLVMYVIAFIFAFMKSESAQAVFRAAIACTILIPVICYAFLLVAHVVRPQKSPLIDTLVFDVGCVLVDFPWLEHLRAQGIPDETIYFFWENETFQKIWREFDLGNLTYEEIHQLFLDAFPDRQDELNQFLDSIKGCLALYPYTLSWLAGLKQHGYKLYVLSNWSDFLYKQLEETGQLAFTAYMDGCLWSYQHHIIKPDPKIFELIRDTYHIDPKRAVFIDDRSENTAAAAGVGFNTITFKDYEDTRRKLKAVGVRWD